MQRAPIYMYVWYIRLQKEKQFETSNQVVFLLIFLGVEKYIMNLDNVQLGSLRTESEVIYSSVSGGSNLISCNISTTVLHPHPFENLKFNLIASLVGKRVLMYL